ncbi:centrosomal protein of 135 kDa isoform X2 [Sesamum indicum]|uniref:Centrosomal protein of 135 kDa isoform X2 n=1 Tax=Sesamum indicum TaxID=4182 RepID=A0A8M8V7J7_SESIN|nr:centrosomal protein of 135 kDa isoform X2 [Sesamum indicum]
MAGSDSQKQLLTLIRDFTAEKSQGERRIAKRKKRIEELRSELDASNRELEEAKLDKETAEQELNGHQVELSMCEASNQALEARIALTNNEISKLASELAALKSEESSLRDGFIDKMLHLNAKIRKFQELFPSAFNAETCSIATLNGGSSTVYEQDAQKARVTQENKLAEILLHTNQEEQQYKAEKAIHDQVQQELINLEKKVLLLESVMKESKELQELRRLTSGLEEKYAALGDELQKRFLCPRCHQDNSEELSEILQISDGS